MKEYDKRNANEYSEKGQQDTRLMEVQECTRHMCYNKVTA